MPAKSFTRSALRGLFGCFLLLLAACSQKSGPADAAHNGMTEARAYYAAHPGFFHFKTPADVPQDLHWQDGMDLPEFADPTAKKGGTLYGFIPDFPRTLRFVGPDANGSFRPWILDDNAMLYAQRHPNDTSLTSDGFHFFPGIADRWALDRATKTVYIHINPDARWSDGVPITTTDSLFTFFFFRSQYIQDPWSNNFYSTNYSGITRFDDHTFALHFPVLRPDILSLALLNEPVPAHFYTVMGDDFVQRYQWTMPPTSGPYILKPADMDKGTAVTLTRNKDWWARNNKFWRYRFNPDRIHLTVIRDTAKAFEAFKRGELDMFGLQLAEYWYDKLPDSSPLVQNGYIHKITFYNDVPRPTYGLWMNESQPLLSNRDIRVGIQYATDWQLVIQKFARGDWQRMQTVADGYGEFTDPHVHARPFDIAKADAAFAKAGFTQRGPDGILVNAQGQRLSFLITTGYANLQDILTILQQQARKAGLEFRLEVLDATAAWKKIQEKKHEIAFSAFAVSPEMFPRFWETYHSVNAYDKAFLPDGAVNPNRQVKTQTNNLQEIAYPELDRMIDAYDKSSSITEMKQLSYQMQEFLHHDASFSPGFDISFIRAGLWRWVGIPKDCNVKIATTFGQYSLYWLDPAKKRATMEAMKSGQTFPPVIQTYDQYKQN